MKVPRFFDGRVTAFDPDLLILVMMPSTRLWSIPRKPAGGTAALRRRSGLPSAGRFPPLRTDAQIMDMLQSSAAMVRAAVLA